MAQQAYTAFQTPVGIVVMTDASSAKNRYGEVLYPKFGPPTMFYAHPTLNPSEVKLSELGWQKDDVELVVRVPHIELRRVALAKDTGELNFDSDARIVVQGKQYEICKIHMKEPFLENVSLYVWIGGRTPNGRST
jgi:hypothetical protein